MRGVTPQYDSLADSYGNIHALDLRTDLEMPTVFRALGRIAGARVLDLGCGDGMYCRLLARDGAARVVGVDVSHEMIRTARAHGRSEALPIRYVVEDAARIVGLGRFDIALAVYLLHYADSQARLERICQRMAEHLAPGGRLVAVVANPEVDPRGLDEPRYGFTMRARTPLADGDEIALDLHTEPPFTIRYHYWSKATYEHALAAAGFCDIAWQPFSVAPHASAKHWKGYLANPHAVVLTGTRGDPTP